jgi:hypothetical protein
MNVSYTAEDVAIVEMPATSVAVIEHRGDPMRLVTANQVYEHLEKTVGRFVSASLYSLGHDGNDAQKTMGIIAVLLYSTPCIVKKTFETAAAAQVHRIVQLKDNQPTLCCKVETVCNDTKPLSAVPTVDGKKRNRHETCIVAVFDARPAVTGPEWQPHVKAIIAVERCVLTFKPATGLWKSSSECSFWLSNRHVLAGQGADAIRKHWGIENKQHYTRDVVQIKLRSELGIWSHADCALFLADRESQW